MMAEQWRAGEESIYGRYGDKTAGHAAVTSGYLIPISLQDDSSLDYIILFTMYNYFI